MYVYDSEGTLVKGVVSKGAPCVRMRINKNE